VRVRFGAPLAAEREGVMEEARTRIAAMLAEARARA